MSDVAAAFDWRRVRWRTWRMAHVLHCCYCTSEIALNAPRLIVCDNGGYRAEFCEPCMVKHFGGQTPPRRRRG